jgi:hypothetical protein
MAVLLKALAKECGGPRQQQGQQGDVDLVKHVVPAVEALVWDPLYVPQSSKLLEVFLHMLGPRVAGEVCLAVQQQLQEADHWVQYERSAPKQVSHLAEALLLGWASIQGRLHAAGHPLVARLQGMVVQQGKAGAGVQRSLKNTCPQVEWRLAGKGRVLLERCVAAAELAAAAGKEQQAL